MININDLCFTYATAASPALSHVSLHIQQGEFVLLTGPSGCGKSSLCRCMNGLIPSFYGGHISGTVQVHAKDTLHTAPNQMASLVGMVFQDPENQLVKSTVEQEIVFGMENQGFDQLLMKKRVEEVLDTIGISHLRKRTISTLSGGEKQKITIASVLALHPQVLVIDEPTSELDPKSAEDVIQLLVRLNEELGITVLLVEHRLDRVLQFVDRTIIMKEGTVSYDGDPRSWMKQNLCVQDTIGLPPLSKLALRINPNDTGMILPLTIKEARQTLLPQLSTMTISKNHRVQTQSFPQEPSLVSVKNLSFQYPNGHISLRNISLDIYPGEFISIIGRNASGKTTLAKLIMGLLQPTKGIITVKGENTKKCSVEQLSHHVGFVFQDPNVHLFADTVEEEICFMMKNLGFSKDAIQQNLDHILHQFQLEQYKTMYPRSLSTGEKQRVALASVLASNPELIILDEPTRGLDALRKHDLIQYLSEFRKQGGTVLLISHDIELVAQHADRVILLSDGKIIADGSKQAVLSNSLHFSPQINRLIQPLISQGWPDDLLTVDDVMERIS